MFSSDTQSYFSHLKLKGSSLSAQNYTWTQTPTPTKYKPTLEIMPQPMSPRNLGCSCNVYSLPLTEVH